MVAPQEQEKKPEAPQEVKEVVETLDIPEHIERAGVSAVPTQFTQQVSDDSGKPMIQTPQTQTVTIQIPATPQQLEDWSKGSPIESLTWFAHFWIRMIKKALHFGWKVIMSR